MIVTEWHIFLTDNPPGQEVEIANLIIVHQGLGKQPGDKLKLKLPDLKMHCEQCKGLRNFHALNTDIELTPERWTNHFLVYQCRNCSSYPKIFAVRIKPGLYGGGFAIKIGEWPPFGPLVPPRTISLIGRDRDLFLKGRRAESLGLGIGAYAYYRQVVENQKDRILDEIAKVAERTNVSPDLIEKIRSAKQETQFSKAIDQVKEVIPETLKINGRNPLSLLYKALSRELHAGTDEECFQLAKDVRIVLDELAERMHQVLKDQTELHAAVNRLTKI